MIQQNFCELPGSVLKRDLQKLNLPSPLEPHYRCRVLSSLEKWFVIARRHFPRLNYVAEQSRNSFSLLIVFNVDFFPSFSFSGVFFDNRVENIKFIDFCGKYRVPFLQVSFSKWINPLNLARCLRELISIFSHFSIYVVRGKNDKKSIVAKQKVLRSWRIELRDAWMMSHDGYLMVLSLKRYVEVVES